MLPQTRKQLKVLLFGISKFDISGLKIPGALHHAFFSRGFMGKPLRDEWEEGEWHYEEGWGRALRWQGSWWRWWGEGWIMDEGGTDEGCWWYWMMDSDAWFPLDPSEHPMYDGASLGPVASMLSRTTSTSTSTLCITSHGSRGTPGHDRRYQYAPY